MDSIRLDPTNVSIIIKIILISYLIIRYLAFVNNNLFSGNNVLEGAIEAARHFPSSAGMALQEAIEDYGVGMLEDTNICSTHVKRISSWPVVSAMPLKPRIQVHFEIN